jgi:long-chain fatty acid transport protein
MALIAGSSVAPHTSYASGFALLEQSAARLGNAFSGTTVVVEDATAMFYNPAALAKLERSQLALSASGVKISSEFRNENSQAALGQPLGSEGGDAGDWNAVPSAYFALPLNERLAFGIGFNVPFGLKLEYPDDWIGRFQALNSEIQTYNFNPALAWEVNDVVTIGIGLNYQRLQAELTNAVNYTAVIAQAAPLAGVPPAGIPSLVAANPGLQGRAIVRGDDSTWGFNVGATFQLTPDTRLGISYRSSVDYEVEGSARFEPATTSHPLGAAIIGFVSAPGNTLATTPVTVDLELPDIATASLSHRVSDRIELLADIAWTGWSSVQELRVDRPDGSAVSTTPELWDDTWRFALGANYDLNDAWGLRVGVAFDETPVPDSTRTARLPDPDRTWVAIGARWDSGGALVLDFGYAHLFSDDVPLDQDQDSVSAYGLLNGEQESAVDIVGVQAAYRF